MDEKEIIKKAMEFENNTEAKDKSDKGLEELKGFLERFPFHEHPEQIDLLTPDKIYNPGTNEKKEAFLYYIEFGTKDVGALRVGHAGYAENARDNKEIFKSLLKKVVDKSLTIAQKVDAKWEDIQRWGKDKQTAKKIIFCYNQEKVMPIFSTSDLERFAKELNLDYETKVQKLFNKQYKDSTLGERFEALNDLLLDYKNRQGSFKNWDNIFFMRFLYKTFFPKQPENTMEQNKLLNILDVLTAKPFLILAGVSGTGKTQIARIVAGVMSKEQ